MATLCDDIGQGRVSSKAAQILDNHAAWKRSNKERRERMKVLMEAKKYGREEETSAGTSSNSQTDPSQSTNVGSSSSVPETTAALASTNTQAMTVGPSDGLGRGFDYSQSMTTSRFNVQVRIGPNGETIIDEESLFVDRAEERDTENYTHVEESDATKFINSASFGRRFKGTRWTAAETELFYDVCYLILPIRLSI